MHSVLYSLILHHARQTISTQAQNGLDYIRYFNPCLLMYTAAKVQYHITLHCYASARETQSQHMF